jgi:hypothetical protein
MCTVFNKNHTVLAVPDGIFILSEEHVIETYNKIEIQDKKIWAHSK